MFKRLSLVALLMASSSAYSMNPPIDPKASAALAASVTTVVAISSLPTFVAKGGCLLASAAFKYVIAPAAIVAAKTVANYYSGSSAAK